jgi:Kef-type K+ transport system membrane component KefB
MAGTPTYVLWLIVAVGGVLFLTRALGALFTRIGQPAVLGAILAGMILGGSLLGVLDPRDPIIHALSQAGVLVLIFEAGLHTEPTALWRAGPAATMVAIIGVVLPFALGYFVTQWLGANWLEATVAGAALCATSIGVSARVLGDRGLLQSKEGRIVLGAAVIDDVIGLAILAIIMSLVTGGALTMESLIRSALLPAAFLFGLMLDNAGLNKRVDGAVKWLTILVVPFFFAVTGAMVNLRALASPRALAVGVALILVGVLGKIVAGWAAPWVHGDKLLIGVAMVPRGEIGLIFAQAGLAAGAIDQGLFGGIMLMVVATTVMTPPLLAAVIRRSQRVAHATG